jgi:hypothetical protein
MPALLHFLLTGSATMKVGREHRKRSLQSKHPAYRKQFGFVQNRLQALKSSSEPFLFSASRQYP